MNKAGKWIANVGIGIVFAIAVYISAQHIVHVAMHYGQTPSEAYALPGILDIFGLFCAIRLRLPNISDVARKLARFGMWFALGTSLWFNVESAIITAQGANQTFTTKALMISAIPAIIVWSAAEILTHVRKASNKISLLRKIINKIFKIKPERQSTASPKPESPSKAPSKAAGTQTTRTPSAPRQRKAPAAETLSATASVE